MKKNLLDDLPNYEIVYEADFREYIEITNNIKAAYIWIESEFLDVLTIKINLCTSFALGILFALSSIGLWYEKLLIILVAPIIFFIGIYCIFFFIAVIIGIPLILIVDFFNIDMYPLFKSLYLTFKGLSKKYFDLQRLYNLKKTSLETDINRGLRFRIFYAQSDIDLKLDEASLNYLLIANKFLNCYQLNDWIGYQKKKNNIITENGTLKWNLVANEQSNKIKEDLPRSTTIVPNNKKFISVKNYIESSNSRRRLGRKASDINENRGNISSSKIHSDHSKLKSENKQAFKNNWFEENKKKIEIGTRGEYFVLNHEKNKLLSLNLEHLATKVEHVSQTIGDGLGYDIISYNEKGERIYIEVKSTASYSQILFLTSNEFEHMKRLGEQYYLYRVYGLGAEFETSIKIFKGRKEILNNVNLEVSTYKAKMKLD